MWRSEARWTKAIRHPHVVAGVELVEGDGELALAMEYVHGPSFALLLDVAARANERPPIAIVLRVMLDVLAALAAVHAVPVAESGRLVHGDVNPRNVLVGDDGVAKLCDFGLAGPEAPYEDRGVFRGTAAYCAPETIERGERTTRSDVFAAGVVLWEALRLERLFRGEGDADSMRRVAVVVAPPLDRDRPELAALAEIARDMLVKAANDRAPSVEVCADRITRAHAIAPRADVAALVRAAAAGELARRREALANDF